MINKTEDVGTESVFRTFPYEVLAGPDDMEVTVSEHDCEFKFNYGKVYWNTRLNTEHGRILSKFKQGETICDVMAGVGPFAVPAGKRGVFVWANDLNPAGVKALEQAVKKNKVEQFVRPWNLDGRLFIRQATNMLMASRRRAVIVLPRKRNGGSRDEKLRPDAPDLTVGNKMSIEEPATFDHYVMNLPATAVGFLDAFAGVYAGRKDVFEPQTDRKLPMVHVYCFSARMDTQEEEFKAVCELVSKHLGHTVTIDMPDVEIFDVRLVSPRKRMFCASFRLPSEVAFAEPSPPQCSPGEYRPKSRSMSKSTERSGMEALLGAASE